MCSPPAELEVSVGVLSDVAVDLSPQLFCSVFFVNDLGRREANRFASRICRRRVSGYMVGRAPQVLAGRNPSSACGTSAGTRSFSSSLVLFLL